MANTVLLKKSSVASKVPLTTDLAYGELALNYTDEKLYFKNASNVIKSLNVTSSALTIGTGLSGTSYNGSSAVTIAIDSTVATKSYVDSVVGISGSQRTTTKVIPTVGQMVFNVTYNPGYIDVFYNGVKLILADDFVATNGTSVTLTNATIAGDVVEFVTYLNIALTDTYTKSQADTKFATIASPTFTGTVGGITKSMVGLSNVDNTTDAGKPVSTATQTILDLKAPIASPTFTGTVSGITKSMVGLSNVDNTTDAGKPVSTATQTALDLKASLASPTFTGTVSGITKSMVGLSNVDNTADANKPISTATQTILDLKAPLASPTFTGTANSANLAYTGTFTGSTGVIAIGTNQIYKDASGKIGFGTASPNVKLEIISTDAILVPKGTAAQQPTGVAGYLRFNTDTAQFEGHNGTTWASVGGSAITNDTTTSTNIYPLCASSTSGTALNVYTSNSKYLYKPSTGELSAPEVLASNGMILNNSTVSTSYTIPTGYNATATGPMTIASGAIVTIPSGSRWMVL